LLSFDPQLMSFQHMLRCYGTQVKKTKPYKEASLNVPKQPCGRTYDTHLLMQGKNAMPIDIFSLMAHWLMR
jgi:hypothetical protein